MYCFSINIVWRLFVPSAFGFTNFIPVIVSPMEHKRDATVAGLGWPSTSNRGTSSTDPDTRPGYQAFELSAPDAPPPTTSITSASLESNTALNNPGTTSPMDTYSAPTQPAVPCPTQESSTFNVFHHARFSSRVVHQIHFKIFTHSNNTRELFIEEIPTSGISKCRDPEHYFYGLSGNWEWSLRTADYWRHHFELPLLHGHNPFHNVPIEPISPPDETWPDHQDPGLSQTTIRHFDGCYGIWGTQRDVEDGWSHELPRRDPNTPTSGEFLLWIKWAPLCILAFYRFTSTGVLPTPQAKLFQNQTSLYARCVCVCIIWTDVKLLIGFSLICRGVQSTVETAPNEAIHLCWKQSLINSVYLQNLVWTVEQAVMLLHCCRNLESMSVIYD